MVKASSVSFQVECQQVLIREGAGPEKCLQDVLVTIDSKHLFIGRAQWKVSWKKVTSCSLDADGFTIGTSKGIYQCVYSDHSPPGDAFVSFVRKKWEKRQEKMQGPEEDVPMVSKPKRSTGRSHVYGGRFNRRAIVGGRTPQRTEADWSSDDDDDKPKQPKEETAMAIDSETMAKDQAAGEETTEDATVIADDETESEDEVPVVRKKKGRARKLRLVVGDEESDDDEHLFDNGTEMTTTLAKKKNVVSPHFDNDDEEAPKPSKEIDPKKPLTPSDAKGSQAITKFFAAPSQGRVSKEIKKQPVTPARKRSPFHNKSSSEQQTPLKADREWLEEGANTSLADSPSTPPKSAEKMTSHFGLKSPSKPKRPPAHTPARVRKRAKRRLAGTRSPIWRPEALRQEEMEDIVEYDSDVPAQQSKAVSALDFASSACTSPSYKYSRHRRNKSPVSWGRRHHQTPPQQPVLWKGLRNMGNTCYMNSSIQMLYALKEFVPRLTGRGGSLTKNVVELADKLQDKESTTNAITPRALKSAVDKVTDKFSGYEQRDAHEFLADLIDRIHDELVIDEECKAEESKEDATVPVASLKEAASEPKEKSMVEENIVPEAPKASSDANNQTMESVDKVKESTVDIAAKDASDHQPMEVDDDMKEAPVGQAQLEQSPQPTNETVGKDQLMEATNETKEAVVDTGVEKETPKDHADKVVVHNDAKPELFPTDAFFRLNLRVCLKCDSCGYEREQEELYRHLSIEVEEPIVPEKENEDDEDKDPILWSVNKGLEKFFAAEKRDVKCEKCKDGKTATQTLSILSSSKALLIHLKRFVVVEKRRLRNSKVSPQETIVGSAEGDDPKNKESAPPPPEMIIQKIKAPVTLNNALSLDKFLFKNENDMEVDGGVTGDYKLKSVVHHIGSTASSGHYTAHSYRETPDEEKELKLVLFDDANVTVQKASVLEGNPRQRSAYMLLYLLE